MGIKIPVDELWAFVEPSSTAIVTTLTAGGWPIALPSWFVVVDGGVWFRTPKRSRKIERIENDPRGSVLIESGLAWGELKAVHWRVRFEICDDEATRLKISDLIDLKYAASRPDPSSLPRATSEKYAAHSFVRAQPVAPPTSWDNSRIKLKKSESAG